MMTGRIEQLSISKGGMPKLAVAEAWIDAGGLVGDAHRNLKHHGGPVKAVLLGSAEDLEELRRAGFDISPGTLGENITTRGIDYRGLRDGMRFHVGGAVLELTKIRKPCYQLEVFNAGRAGAIQRAIDEVRARGGYYARVVSPGWVRAGDIIQLADTAV